MALGTFDRAVIKCSCKKGTISTTVRAYDGTAHAEEAIDVPLHGTRTTEQEDQWDAINEAVKADPPTADVWYL